MMSRVNFRNSFIIKIIRLLTLLYILFLPALYAQKSKEPKESNSEGEALVELTGNMTMHAAEATALQNARINAIEKIFGTAIFQGNSTFIRNKVTGDETRTETMFNMIADSYVNGDWIEDLKPPRCEKITDDDKFYIRCQVYGRVREMVRPKTSFECFPLNRPDLNYKTDQFRQNQQLYLYFRSPADGYLTVFYVSDNEAFRILPYQQTPPEEANMFHVIADKSYILFSSEMGEHLSKNVVDELVLETVDTQTIDRLFLIFSHQLLMKPGLENKDQVYLSVEDMDRGFTMPKSMEAEDFQKWLMKNRIYNRQIEVKIIDITISKQ